MMEESQIKMKPLGHILRCSAEYHHIAIVADTVRVYIFAVAQANNVLLSAVND